MISQGDLVIELIQDYRLPAVTPGTPFVIPPQDQQSSDGLPIGGLAELPTLLEATCCLPAWRKDGTISIRPSYDWIT